MDDRLERYIGDIACASQKAIDSDWSASNTEERPANTRPFPVHFCAGAEASADFLPTDAWSRAKIEIQRADQAECAISRSGAARNWSR